MFFNYIVNVNKNAFQDEIARPRLKTKEHLHNAILWQLIPMTIDFHLQGINALTWLEILFETNIATINNTILVLLMFSCRTCTIED